MDERTNLVVVGQKRFGCRGDLVSHERNGKEINIDVLESRSE